MSKEYSFYKIGHTDDSVVKSISPKEFEASASTEVTDRLNKFAQTVRAIAPRSDDFLYFSIIFLKAAETSTIDENGNIKKLGKENAWGYFDDNWKWHGNVKPHKNNNNDIFPASELRKAARNWIGRPLCVDHKSDSVDGVRGVILDTYYDESRMQVVGLCALDKVNYPELARKVETGIVRYGSMGTAVATSICSECSNRATTPKEYCNDITSKRAWGEINVGLNPIEYSLVVQPAEPGAILLRCFASIQKHDEELKSYGVDTKDLYKSLDEKTAGDLDLLLNSVCGVDGCSLDQRQRIVKGFLNTNGFTKVAQSNITEDLRNLAEAEKNDIIDKETAQKLASNIINQVSVPAGESMNSGESQNVGEGSAPLDESIGVATGGVIAAKPIVEQKIDFPNRQEDGDVLAARTASKFNNKTNKINSIMEEIMNEARLRKRAAIRRKLAYHQGGSEGVEPKTFKTEDYHQYWSDDKQMHQTKSMGGDDGMFPGDEKVKEMQKRAKEKAVATKKIAYHFGGSEGVEPKTFKSEDYHKYWEDDKQMHQTKSMGGAKGLFPGDEKVKEMQKRAGYNGPALSTKFKQKRNVDGTINKSASCFEVYAGDNLVIAATAKDIFGPKLEENWAWITSKDYAKTVVASIRENGVDYVGRLLTKTAQAAPPPPPAPEGGGMPPMPPMPPMAPEVMGAGEGAPMDEGADAGAEAPPESPKEAIEAALVSMESNIDDIRTSLEKLTGTEDVDVNINVGKPGVGIGEEGSEGAEKLALSRKLFGELKIALAESKDSADELALLSETYDRYGSLSKLQRNQLSSLTRDAIKDFADIVTQSSSLVRMANVVSKDLVKIANKNKASSKVKTAAKAPVQSRKVASAPSSDSSLVASALELRKNRRLDLIKNARLQLVSTAQEMMGESTNESNMADDMENASYGHDGHHKETESMMLDMTAKDKMMHHSKDKDMHHSMDKMMHDAKDKKHDEHDAKDKKHDEHEAKDEHDAKDKEEKKHSHAKLNESFLKKKAEEEREAYRVKLRRAYNIAMEMQKKGMIAQSRPALDRQVDSIMEFDDRAFEAFKRSVANFTGTVTNVKTASDVSGLNIGVNEDGEGSQASGKVDAKTLASLWE